MGEVLKGYKGFSKGLVCRGKQYAENTVFEENDAVICKKGLHFCENPMDVLDHYSLLDGNGEFNEFAEVEALDECKTDDNKKFCTKKLRVGAKMTIPKFIKSCVDVTFEKTFFKVEDLNLADSSKLAASGNYSKLAASGDESKLAASGNYSKLAASGNYSQLAASGYSSQLAASGNYSKLAASGDSSKLAASGNYSKLAASGNYSQLAASGYSSQLESTGEDSVLCCAGHGSKAKAQKGSWITLAEWGWSDEKNRSVPVCVKTEYVDGERIKADTWYKLENGEFKEV